MGAADKPRHVGERTSPRGTLLAESDKDVARWRKGHVGEGGALTERYVGGAVLRGVTRVECRHLSYSFFK